MQARRDWIIGILLFVATMLLYWPTTNFPFVNYDDQLYVYQNPDVIEGLSWPGFKWALTANVAANWHPLTILSHMTDCSLYHLFAGGHHLTNILLHSLNVVLLYVLFKRMTGFWGVSALAAALFAFHPLNVESVAWIAERKNVLSMFFFILTLLAYLNYGKNPRPSMYVLALILFALGLAAKPILVTLPFLLLLLDYWPLYRIQPQPDTSVGTGKNVQLLFLEKVPFFVFAIADSITTYFFQKSAGSVELLANEPLTWRLANVPISYATYLGKTFFPARLCVLYSFPEKLPVATAVVSLALLVIVTVGVLYLSSKSRWLFVGWFWFLGTLVPVIGIVQSGVQAWADRHAYIPLIGIFLIISLPLHELLSRKPTLSVYIVLLVAAFLCFCAVLAQQQISYWRSSVALFDQAVTVNPGNPFAQNLLGTAFNGEGKLNEAIEHFAIASSIRPNDVDYQYNLGLDLINVGNFTNAETHLDTAVRLNPNDAVLHNALGVTLVQLNKPGEAEHEFSLSIALRPDYEKPYVNLGKAFLKTGNPLYAITNFIAASHLDPNSPEPLENLAAAYAACGNISNAISNATQALNLAELNQQTNVAMTISKQLENYKTNSTPR